MTFNHGILVYLSKVNKKNIYISIRYLGRYFIKFIKYYMYVRRISTQYYSNIITYRLLRSLYHIIFYKLLLGINLL